MILSNIYIGTYKMGTNGWTAYDWDVARGLMVKANMDQLIIYKEMLNEHINERKSRNNNKPEHRIRIDKHNLPMF